MPIPTSPTKTTIKPLLIFSLIDDCPLPILHLAVCHKNRIFRLIKNAPACAEASAGRRNLAVGAIHACVLKRFGAQARDRWAFFISLDYMDSIHSLISSTFGTFPETFTTPSMTSAGIDNTP